MFLSFGKKDAQVRSPQPLHPAPLPSHSAMQHSLSQYLPRPLVDRRKSLPESPFSNFPLEIVRIIVARAAAMCPETTLTLTLVSKTVRHWVEPTLYHTVVLWTPHTVQLFRVAFDAKPPSFFATHVHNLFINDEHGTDIILACSSVQRLAAYPPALVGLPESDLDDDDFSPLGGPSSPLRIDPDMTCPTPGEVCLMGSLDDIPWASPLFHNVQFLYLGLEPPTPETACDLSLLPSLTFCSFPYDNDEEDALLLTISTLLQSTTLQILLILVNDEEGNPDRDRKGSIWVKLACMVDTRLLVGTEGNFDGEDWQSCAREGIDICALYMEEYKDWRHDLL